MKIARNVAGVLLGLLFVMASLTFILKLGPTPTPPPADSPAGMFMGATFATGFLAYVKVFELLGGLLVAFPRTRALGLLFLVPIVANIFAFHIFIARAGYLDPMLLVIAALTLFLVWSHRRGLAALAATR